jgi:hypothetical protein
MTTLEFWIASVVLAALRRDWQAGRWRSPRRLVGTTLARSTTEHTRRQQLVAQLPTWVAAGGAVAGLSRSIPLHTDQRSGRSGIE